MRTLLLAVLLLTSVFALPAASAKAFADDPQGDTTTDVFGVPSVPAAAPGADAADLLAMEILEDAEQLTFILQLVNLNQQFSFTQYRIDFSWHKVDYTVAVERRIAQGVIEDNSEAYLYSSEDERGFDPLAPLDHIVDLEKNSVTVFLPKAYILSDNGRYPLLGDELKDIVVEAEAHSTLFQFTANSYDRMPDGEAGLKYAFEFGDLRSGSLRLDADERVRVSNGGATTFVYKVSVFNQGETDDAVDLVVTDLPPEWNVTIQSPLRVPAESQRAVAVLVSVPFAHDHGGFSSFNLTATSQDFAQNTASIRMGVLHTPIPQPAGHHSDLYLHAETFSAGLVGDIFAREGGSMNTDAAHDADAPEVSPNHFNNGFGWRIPLSPGLRMGLDFDIEELGELTGAILGHQSGSGTVSAQLYLIEGFSDHDSIESGLLLADSDSQAITLDVNNAAPFKLTLTPTEDAEYIPYAGGQNLVLLLSFEGDDGISFGCCLPGATPGLMTADFKLSLPLLEYHDRLTGLAEAGDLLELKADGLVEKRGLPGTTMTYTFELVNHGPAAEMIDIDLAGTDAALGTIVPSGTIELGSKERRTLTMAVSIPTGKNEGEELEVLIFAHAQEDPSKSAIARTKTIIGKPGASELAADESSVLLAAQERESKDTPAPGALAVLAAVATALVVARRRL